MAQKRIGQRTLRLQNPPSILAGGTVVGPKEGQGPLGHYFDIVLEDDYWQEKSWELGERKMFREAVELAIEKANLKVDDIDFLLGGDLLNQVITASFAARELKLPFFGLYGACSTMAESLSLGALLIDGGFADHVVCATASHFSTAERQYRTPLEMGTQRPLSAQWTVTGSGASVLGAQGNGPYITSVTAGQVVDLGITDVNNMGAAMAPAAVDTLLAHFQDLSIRPEAYDCIMTGDLGEIGARIVREKMRDAGYPLGECYGDCGCEIFSHEQDPHAGGSGCGCSAVTLNGYLLDKLNEGSYKNLLFVATGALMSTVSSQQGESIPGIAHAVAIDTKRT